jgi:hydrogenase nickel incorporation protein HypB
MQPRIVEVREGILKKNDLLARELRARYRAAGVYVVSLVSGPGAGKTELLQKTLAALKPTQRVAALVGDLATERDAERLSRAGVPVRQIVTGTVCHLEAEMVSRALDGWRLDELDVLFVENVGNLVCPSSYDLGEDLRVVLHAVTEGEDKPLKYPTIFNSADLAIVTKIDLAEAVGFDREEAHRNIRAVCPEARVLETSARTGAGMDDWIRLLGAARRSSAARS